MNKNALDITSFTRLVWKSNDIKNEWQNKINRASRTYNEAEWLTVKKGHRKVCTAHMDKNRYEDMVEKLSMDEMYFRPLHRTAKYSGFSHKHIKPKDDNYDVYGVVSTEKEYLDEFEKADENGDHNTIGTLLDFPECCRDNFDDVWPDDIDPIFPAAKNMKDSEYYVDDGVEYIEVGDIPIETNDMLRYFGIRITSHLSCSFDCGDTIEKGKYWKDTMKDYDLGGFNILKELLEMDMKWDANNGIVEVTTPIFKGITTTGLYDKRRIIKVGEVDW